MALERRLTAGSLRNKGRKEGWNTSAGTNRKKWSLALWLRNRSVWLAPAVSAVTITSVSPDRQESWSESLGIPESGTLDSQSLRAESEPFLVSCSTMLKKIFVCKIYTQFYYPQTHRYSGIKLLILGQARWLTPVIPALWETKVGGSRSKEFETILAKKFHSCCPRWSAMVRSGLTTTSASWIRVAFLRQPPEELLLQTWLHHVGQAGLELLISDDLPTLASQSSEITG
ncbi:LOW QUALITY PROTEIN: NANOG neighbor homeobox, partial [Plecturocebus cupreus]